MLSVALLDLDDTLYDSGNGLWQAIGRRITLYLTERLGLTEAEARLVRQTYLEAFGTTLNGLRHHYHIDPDDYLAFVHDVPLADYLAPDPALDGMLGRLPLRKIVFTNSDAPHAARVLAQLGIARHFELIVDIHALGFVNKPEPEAYALALARAGVAANECLFADDAVRNLAPAKRLGMLAVWVRPDQAHLPNDAFDYAIPRIHELEPLLARVDRGNGRRAAPRRAEVAGDRMKGEAE